MEKKKVILLVVCLFLINLVYAAPPIPNHFIGNVTIDGQNAPVETLISIYVDSVLESVYSVSEEGKYDLFVKTGESGNEIEFKISDILAGTWNRSNGETVPLDLSIITTTTTPPSSGSSSGGGSGGGGGGSSGGGGGGFVSSPSTTETNESSSDSEDVTQEENQEEEKQKKINPGITGAAIGFLGSGKGKIVIAFVIILGIGVILIKFKPQKWKKRISH